MLQLLKVIHVHGKWYEWLAITTFVAITPRGATQIYWCTDTWTKTKQKQNKKQTKNAWKGVFIF